jgi:hypothetical protein
MLRSFQGHSDIIRSSALLSDLLAYRQYIDAPPTVHTERKVTASVLRQLPEAGSFPAVEAVGDRRANETRKEKRSLAKQAPSNNFLRAAEPTAKRD